NFYKLSPEYQPDGRCSKEAATEYVMRAFVTGESRFRWTHKMPDGELFVVEIILFRVPNGEDYNVIGFIQDLREQEAAQVKMDEARKLVERYINAKSELIASISHEIRTPMNAIQAMARVAGEVNGISDNRRNIINQGIHSTQLLMSAIDMILVFSKLDSGRISLENREFSLSELIEGISSIVSEDARQKSLTYSASINEDIPDLLIGDSMWLRQAVFNIVINAVKFTETGGVSVRVYHEKTQNQDELLLTFEVCDTGIGITDEQKANIFNPLYTGDTSYSRKHGGLGMGLSVSKSLVVLMGGEITCESNPGDGSVFRIIIPFTVPEKKVIEEKVPVIPRISDLCGLRVLVAEDNIINQMIMEELLTTVGVSVTIAENGIEALAKLEEEKFDVILMDIQMPEMDGLTATTKIRADQRYGSIPILAMTANVGKEYHDESINAGMNDHLTKPVDTVQLYNALIEWSSRKAIDNG
ncbi:MAG: response regulator, partial [Peptococcaceae bacterium]|nr:response regulator [Peptococcaceae bacterium]